MLSEPVNVYSAPEELTSPKFAKAFAQGCNGIIRTEYVEGTWAGFLSPRYWGDLQKNISLGHDWYYGDHAYFGRKIFYRVTKNADQHSGIGKTNHERLKPFWRHPAPWRRTGTIIVLCPQTEHYFERNGMTQAGWIEDTRRELRKYTDRKIVVHQKRDDIPLKALFRKTWAVVSYRSMSSLEAIMNGIPAISTGKSAVSGLCTPIEKIEKPFYPDDLQRMNVAGVLADNQWTFEEMQNGKCWRDLHAGL